MVKINLQTRYRLGAITLCLLAAGCTDFSSRSEPMSRLQGSPRVQDLYQNRSPEVVRYDRYTLASMGGYIWTSGTATGAMGSWTLPLSQFGISTTQGHIAALLTTDELGAARGENDRLYRFSVTGKPDLNTMHTSIDSGFVTQTDSYKSAAVVVQRVADVITRSGQLHVYNPLTGQKSPGYWPPEPVKENTGTKNHKWQRLSPQLSQTCAVFPDTNGQIAQDGNYAWALWQPYSCCKRRGQTFLSSTDFS